MKTAENVGMVTSLTSVCLSVNYNPNRTAHWHNANSGRKVRQSWAYDAFRRAVQKGYIKPFIGASQNTTTYIITHEGVQYLHSQGY